MGMTRQHDAALLAQGQAVCSSTAKRPRSTRRTASVEELERRHARARASPVRRLSGGNVQKVLVGREIAQRPTVLLTAYAVRGLDINIVLYHL